MQTTAGKFLLKDSLPSQYHGYIDDNILDKKGITNLFDKLAQTDKEGYNKIVSDLVRLGFEVSSRHGASIDLDDLLPPFDVRARYDIIEKQVKEVQKGPGSDASKKDRIFNLYHEFLKKLDDEIVEKGLKEGKSLAQIIRAGSRGSPAQYRGTIATQGIVIDNKGQPLLDFPIKSSFAEGLSAPEYLAHAYGARTGEVAKKLATADSGYMCLTADTQVLMADGTSKEIQYIEEGDMVVGSDFNGCTKPVKVTKKFDHGVQEVYEYIFRSLGEERRLNATPKHKMLGYFDDTDLIGKYPMELADFRASAFTCIIADTTRSLTHARYSSSSCIGEVQVYDIEVDHPDHLFVLANGLVSSNSKQLSRASMTVKVEEHDCQTARGLPRPVKDKDNVGAFLAYPAGKYKRNDEITPKMLGDLENEKIDKIIVRSATTCDASKHHHFGAVCQMCMGKREKGLPRIGDYVGITSATALGEPLAQSQLNVRHGGGAASKGGIQGGFKTIEQFANIPQAFKNKAPLSEDDGIVEEVRVAPAGGHFVTIKGKEYYVATDLEVKVKKGDKVERGDILSEGLVNPSDMVRLKGVGEGRRYFVDTMKELFDNSGMGVNRRNFEVIGKAAIDHVEITNPEGIGDHLPGKIVSYSALAAEYKPRENAKKVKVDDAYGKYLEEEVLHYSIGTKLTQKMIAELKSNGVTQVLVHDNEPGFAAHMVRLLDVPETVPDWAHQLYSTYLERRLITGVTEGLHSSIKGPSPVLGLAYGKGFGVVKESEYNEELEKLAALLADLSLAELEEIRHAIL